ncbi:MAG: hypothetical protein Q6K18_03530 [Gloeomargarita sp. DG_1_5_bins_55]
MTRVKLPIHPARARPTATREPIAFCPMDVAARRMMPITTGATPANTPCREGI